MLAEVVVVSIKTFDGCLSCDRMLKKPHSKLASLILSSMFWFAFSVSLYTGSLGS